MSFKQIVISAILILGLVAAPQNSMAQEREPGTQPEPALTYLPGELVLRLDPGVAELTMQASRQNQVVVGHAALDRLQRKWGVTRIEPLFRSTVPDSAARKAGTKLDSIFLLTVPSQTDIWRMAEEYAANPSVIYAEPNLRMQFMSEPSQSPEPDEQSGLQPLPNDPGFVDQYSLYNTGQNGGTPGSDVGILGAWTVQTGNPDVLIAVLDTGVDHTHPDLARNVRTDIDFDFVDNDNDAMDSETHGTGAAGVIGATVDNGLDLAGACPDCAIVPIRVGDIVHVGSVAVAQGIYYATIIGADIVSMSLGGQCSDLWADVVNFAYSSDVTLVAAAGNYVPFVVYPARFDQVIGVSATDRIDGFAGFSSFGPQLDISAPGAEIRLLSAGGGTREGNGTSYATPLTAAVLGLLKAQNDALTNAQLRQIVRDSSFDLGPPGFDDGFGWGRLDANLALSISANPPQTVYAPGLDTCGCVLEQTVGQGNGQPILEQMRYLRDEILTTGARGEEITDLYYDHSLQVAAHLFRDPELAGQMTHLIETAAPYLASLAQDGGQRILEAEDIEILELFINRLAKQGSPALASDLLRIWNGLDLQQYVGLPVHSAIAALQPTQQHRLYLPEIWQ